MQPPGSFEIMPQALEHVTVPVVPLTVIEEIVTPGLRVADAMAAENRMAHKSKNRFMLYLSSQY
jgi:hypothetical protein